MVFFDFLAVFSRIRPFSPFSPFTMDQKYFYLNGSLQEEADFNLRDLNLENCALAGAFYRKNAGLEIYKCLSKQKNRGNDGAGIFTGEDKDFSYRKRIWDIKTQFDKTDFANQLPGEYGIGHTRYATVGKHSEIANLQPLFFKDTKFWSFALAHNGTLPNIKNVKDKLLEKWAIFQSGTDSEIFAYLITISPKDTIEEAVMRAANKIKLAYSLLIMTDDKIIALKDRYGVRPLHAAKMRNGGYLIASETHAFNPYQVAWDIEEEIEIKPGEMKVFNIGATEPKSHQYAEADEHRCIFEGIYFSHPRSKHHGKFHEDFRKKLGKRVFEENPNIQGDYIIRV